jgi:hypothetical protein
MLQNVGDMHTQNCGILNLMKVCSFLLLRPNTSLKFLVRRLLLLTPLCFSLKHAMKYPISVEQRLSHIIVKKIVMRLIKPNSSLQHL